MSLLSRAILPTLLVLAACSDPRVHVIAPANVAGFWKLWAQVEGDPAEVGPLGGYFAQNGTAIDSVDTSGVVSGNRITWNIAVSDPTTVYTYNGTVNGAMASGTFTITGQTSATGTWRAEQFQPTGTLTASGSVLGAAVDVDTATAFCERVYTDAQLALLGEVNVVFMDEGRRLELNIDPGSLAVGMLNVAADVAVGVTYATDTSEQQLAGIGGTLDVTQYDVDGFAATFTIDLGGAETLTGSFAVVFDIDAYLP